MSKIVFITVFLFYLANVGAYPNNWCPPNEEYSDCYLSPQKDCTNYNKPILTTDCQQGCVCISGFVRIRRQGPCIPIEWCSDALAAGCSSLETYTQCEKLCETTCEDKDITTCHLQCVPGCVCIRGYARHEDGYCTLPIFCTNSNSPPNESDRSLPSFSVPHLLLGK